MRGSRLGATLHIVGGFVIPPAMVALVFVRGPQTWSEVMAWLAVMVWSGTAWMALSWARRKGSSTGVSVVIPPGASLDEREVANRISDALRRHLGRCDE